MQKRPTLKQQNYSEVSISGAGVCASLISCNVHWLFDRPHVVRHAYVRVDCFQLRVSRS